MRLQDVGLDPVVLPPALPRAVRRALPRELRLSAFYHLRDPPRKRSRDPLRDPPRVLLLALSLQSRMERTPKKRSTRRKNEGMRFPANT
mmetsp:Transcript_8791/g.17395  ORF Transcript_8791/g.17395 Transcript_8791/m.17395 type:complete len:89 (+) Transcript_8791:46-312(+)